MELFDTLGIDWGMLIAQLINYGVLLVALSVLLYKPILRMLDERRERISKSMEDSKRIQEQLRDIEKQRAASMKELDTKASALLADAKKQADASRAELVAAAQKEVEGMLERGRKQLEDEKRSMLGSLEKTVAKASVTLAGKILQREFSPADQDRLLGSLKNDIPTLIK